MRIVIQKEKIDLDILQKSVFELEYQEKKEVFVSADSQATVLYFLEREKIIDWK